MKIVGIDGGATKVNGWDVNYNKESGLFSLGDRNVQKKYREYGDYDPGFVPVDINIQLEQLKDGIILTEAEKQQGRAYIQAAADVIAELIKDSDEKAYIGFGMPGLKTADKRGITVLANGPRMPHFVDEIEEILKKRNLQFHPVKHLGSDADYCGLGEEYAAEGLFRDVANAYYLGGGTGVADAMKLRGEVLPFDKAKEWIAKTWEMKNDTGLSLERYASASGIQYIYSRHSGVSVEQLNQEEIYPPQILHKAMQGEEAAVLTMQEVGENIAGLLYERIWTIYHGWQGLFDFVNPSKPPLKNEHPYRGTLLERIIIGQRLGDLLQESKSTPFLWKKILTVLTGKVMATQDTGFKEHYLKDDKFDENFILISKLREAPVLGAAADAYLNL